MVKRSTSIHGTLQKAIVAAINDPNYSFSLPNLADWESVVSSTQHEKERLEFVGDALMHLSVALHLYRLFPNALPGLYTNIRSALNTNATFTHLMAKAGAYELPMQSHSTKAAADSFEVIVAALYMERGFADVYSWVHEQYAPLIDAARESYDKCLTTPLCNIPNIPLLSNKRRRDPLDNAGTPLLKKLRLSRRSPSRSTLMAQRVINRMKSKGRVKLYLPAKKPLEMRLHSKRRTPEPPRPSSLMIDLTVDSDSDDEDFVSSDSAHASLPRVKAAAASHYQLSPLLQPHAKPGLRNDQIFAKYSAFHRPPQEDPTVSRSQSHRASESSFSSQSSSVTATSSDHVTHTSPQVTFKFFRRSSHSTPISNKIHTTFGTHENPIVIEDSDTES